MIGNWLFYHRRIDKNIFLTGFDCFNWLYCCGLRTLQLNVDHDRWDDSWLIERFVDICSHTEDDCTSAARRSLLLHLALDFSQYEFDSGSAAYSLKFLSLLYFSCLRTLSLQYCLLSIIADRTLMQHQPIPLIGQHWLLCFNQTGSFDHFNSINCDQACD